MGNEELEEIETLLGVLTPQDPERVKALKEAADLITGDRQEEYGPPEVNFLRIATIWSILLNKDFTPSDVATAMVGLKLARAAQGYKRDTFIDAAGYAAIVVELKEKGL